MLDTTRCWFDRVLTSLDGLQLFPGARVHHLSYPGSDYVSLFLTLTAETDVQALHSQSFQFENIWLRHDKFQQLISEARFVPSSLDPCELSLQISEECRVGLLH